MKRWSLPFFVCLCFGSINPVAAAESSQLTIQAPKNGSGLKLNLQWSAFAEASETYVVLRSQTGPDGPWVIAKHGLDAKKTQYQDKVTNDVSKQPPASRYWYRVSALPGEFQVKKDTPIDQVLSRARISRTGEGVPVAYLFKNIPGIWLLLILIVAVAGMMFFFTRQVRRGHEIRIRRIAGIDAIEEVLVAPQRWESLFYMFPASTLLKIFRPSHRCSSWVRSRRPSPSIRPM